MNMPDAADIDALFQLPLSEFTAARNALAARLKKAGKAQEAAQIKSLAKPSMTAWAVNQLYWEHRDVFDILISAGRRLGREQAAQLSGKAADVRGALAQRKDAI